MNKVVCLGRGKYGLVYCTIKYEDKKLSISGVEGPMRNGNCIGSCGQIVGTPIQEYAVGWNADLVKRFYEVWPRLEF